MMQKPILLLIGLGKTGRLLIEKLHPFYQIYAVDSSKEKILSLKKRFPWVTFIEGDALNPFVLKKAYVEKAYWCIIVVREDKEAEEIVDLLQKKFRKERILVKVKAKKIASSLRKKGVYAIIPPEVVVNVMVNTLQVGEVLPLNIGKGEGEILQIELTPHSPIVGRKLKELPPQEWIIGAIYRPKRKGQRQISPEDTLIIPHGDTIPKEGDKLILIGEPRVLREVAQYLRQGAPIFPRRYGKKVFLYLPPLPKEKVFHQELYSLLRSMEEVELYVLSHDKEIYTWIKEKFSPQLKGIHNFSISSFSYALRILRKYRKEMAFFLFEEPQGGFYPLLRPFLVRIFLRILRKEKIPVWLMRKGSLPVRISLLISSLESSLDVVELVMDVALKFSMDLEVIALRLPSPLWGDEEEELLKKNLSSLREIASLYGVPIEEKYREGNPVWEVLKEVKRENLLAFSLPKKARGGFLVPNPYRLLLFRFQGSILFLPTQ